MFRDRLRSQQNINLHKPHIGGASRRQAPPKACLYVVYVGISTIRLDLQSGMVGLKNEGLYGNIHIESQYYRLWLDLQSQGVCGLCGMVYPMG